MSTKKFIVHEGLVINSSSGNVSLEIHANDAILLPTGNTGQRPTGSNGHIRYNSETGTLDYYLGGAWDNPALLSGAAFTGIVNVAANLNVTGDRVTFGDAAFFADLVDANVPYVQFEAGSALYFARNSNTYQLSAGGVDMLFANSTTLTVNATVNASSIQLAGSSIVGKQAVYISATSMYSRTTNGPQAGTNELAKNDIAVSTLDFDATTSEAAQFEVVMPSSWNEGTVTFKPVWSHANTTTNFGVVWELEGVAFADGDTLDTAFGTGQTSIDTGGANDAIYIGPESSAITIAGTPGAGEYVQFQVNRLPANGSDTLAVDARLHGIVLYITTDTLIDS